MDVITRKAEMFVDFSNESALNAVILLQLVSYYFYGSPVMSYEALTSHSTVTV